MKRFIDYFLLEWKNNPNHKPLLLRGARQVGKTHAARELGKTFLNFIEINIETDLQARKILEQDLDLERIILQLSELLQKKIIPGTTLLFIDEIQQSPQAITALRYFYEKMPQLHVIAAGSLLDFALEQISVPVGRVSFLYMYPLSFLEFLAALGHASWIEAILTYTPENPMSKSLQEKLISILSQYSAIGGMPDAVNEWIKTQSSRSVKTVHSHLLETYQADFGKYSKKYQIKYVELIFLKAMEQLSRKFIFSHVGEYQKRELSPSLDLLEKAGLLYPVIKSDGQGIPLGAYAEADDFKLIFLDIGLSQKLLGLDIASWIIGPLDSFYNKGEIIEAFIGQELLAYSDPISKEKLYYWRKDSRGSSAEVDYLIQIKDQAIPIEVKAGTSKRIKSMHLFLDSHSKSSYGLRFWTGDYAKEERIISFPLFALAKPLADNHPEVKAALLNLM